MGKAELAERVVQKFLTLVRPYTEEVADAAARQDPDALRRSAHRLKGAAATVSAVALSQIAAELEALGRENNPEPAPALVGRLRAEVERLIQVHGGNSRRAA
jgi:HPt (histidine-containing phosphotransfer) domain-containing protein